MIVGLFLNLIFAAVWALTLPITLLDDVVLPADISSAISTSKGYLYATDFVVPTTSIIIIFALILVIEGSILGWKGFNWLLKRLPTQS